MTRIENAARIPREFVEITMPFDWIKAAGLPIGRASGVLPTHETFFKKGSLAFGRHVWVEGVSIHDDPTFFKYYWRIWTEAESMPLFDYWHAEAEGRLVFPTELTFSEAVKRMTELCEHGAAFIVTNERAKRSDPAAPWDVAAVLRNGGRLAPSYDQDGDVPFFGHK